MKIKHVFNLICILLCCERVVAEAKFEDRFHERLMQVGWSRIMQELNSYTFEQQRYIAARAVVAMGRNGVPEEPERMAVFQQAQSFLTSKPGHAKYYQDQIEKTRDLAREHAKLPKEEQSRLMAAEKWVGPGTYDDVRDEAFINLGLLPSPETVAVLGHFVESAEGLDHRDILGNIVRGADDVTPAAPNCGKAFLALAKLGIEHPPAKVNYPDLGDLDWDIDRVNKWKDWWGEVKAGKRTYRFVGSDIEYGPDGPATKAQLEKIAKDRKRAESGRKGTSAMDAAAGDGVSSKAPLFALVIAGAVLLASLMRYFRGSAKS